MQNKTLFGLTLLVAVAATFLFNGCSVVGFTVGAIIDGSKPDRDTIPGPQVVAKVGKGDTVEIIQKNGEHLRGEYVGTDTISMAEYAQRYNETRKQNQGITLPALGDTIDINNYLSEAEFLGFGDEYILVKRQVNPQPTRFALDRLTSIRDSRGNVIEGETLKKLLHDGKLPLLSAIVIKNGLRTTRVPIDSLRQVDIPATKNAKWGGLVFGAGVDVAVVAVVAIIDAIHNIHLDFSGNGGGGWG